MWEYSTFRNIDTNLEFPNSDHILLKSFFHFSVKLYLILCVNVRRKIVKIYLNFALNFFNLFLSSHSCNTASAIWFQHHISWGKIAKISKFRDQCETGSPQLKGINSNCRISIVPPGGLSSLLNSNGSKEFFCSG